MHNESGLNPPLSERTYNGQALLAAQPFRASATSWK
jgi:hypothetical protein